MYIYIPTHAKHSPGNQPILAFIHEERKCLEILVFAESFDHLATSLTAAFNFEYSPFKFKDLKKQTQTNFHTKRKQTPKLWTHGSERVPTFFLRVRWRLHLRKSRLFFGEIFRLAVLIQGHVQVRVLAFQHVSRVTTGIRLIQCPGLFHISAVTGHSLNITTTVTRTIFKIRVIVSGLHVAIAAGSRVHFIYFLHTVVHFVILVHFLLYIYTHSTHAFTKPIHPESRAYTPSSKQTYTWNEKGRWINTTTNTATQPAVLWNSTWSAKILFRRRCLWSSPAIQTYWKADLLLYRS